jgi:hypothetical protein
MKLRVSIAILAVLALVSGLRAVQAEEKPPAEIEMVVKYVAKRVVGSKDLIQTFSTTVATTLNDALGTLMKETKYSTVTSESAVTVKAKGPLATEPKDKAEKADLKKRIHDAVYKVAKDHHGLEVDAFAVTGLDD